MSQGTAAARVPTRPIARPAARERPQPKLRVVAPRPRHTAGGLALLSVGLLGIGLLVLLLLNISIGKGAYALTELQNQQRQLAQDRQSLAEQVEASSAPDKLAARAAKLGMVPNPNPAFVDLPDGTVQGEPEVAQAPPPSVKARPAAKKSIGAAAAVASAGKKSVEKAAAAAAADAAAKAGGKPDGSTTDGTATDGAKSDPTGTQRTTVTSP